METKWKSGQDETKSCTVISSGLLAVSKLVPSINMPRNWPLIDLDRTSLANNPYISYNDTAPLGKTGEEVQNKGEKFSVLGI